MSRLGWYTLGVGVGRRALVTRRLAVALVPLAKPRVVPMGPVYIGLLSRSWPTSVLPDPMALPSGDQSA